ncbi:iron-sulfur cluster repair di-iron protein [Sediminibacterium soli]|uniref:iron-sulfur cluster repair di-iron protein n=1 Tax=Sediminibacterium soli TaxID=2698829 RepID=UPI00137A1113|nr:iron-sulfur cluster repair di-iron protein [Sediminibacterium soli]NCI46277.1 iron-sulfur cluster repair di-iron protein [Sediminibacterium soli]
METVFIDVTALEPRMKHPVIFTAFDDIAEGTAVVIHNDHDPKPLYYQLLGERGNCFSWTYLLNGPEVWEVEIKKNSRTAETVGEMAAKDMRKAELLKRLGIDFCCGGKRSLEQACDEKGLDVLRVRQQLEEEDKKPAAGSQPDFTSFKPAFLADYIVNVHHAYVYQNAPLIEELSQKVAAHHGAGLPFLHQVAQKTSELVSELLTHLKKEEAVLFPAIRLLETEGKAVFASLKEPIYMMERDHDIAGELTREIRTLTSDYTVPEDACNSLRMLYHKLAAFESDLLQHIHLENNILFPKALAMAK